MVGPTNRKPRSARAALIASDSRERAGRSRSVRRRYCLGVPPTKPQRKSPNEAPFSWNARNARAFLAFQENGASFGDFLWGFVGGTPKQYRRRTLRDLPARSRESDAMSAALAERGFRFVGPTICYAFMQAVGMVNDHLVTCFRHAELGGRA